MRANPFLCLSFIPATLFAQTFTGEGGSIPNDGNWLETTIEVNGLVPGTIDTIGFGLEQVCITVEHEWLAEIDVLLVAPDGTGAILVSGNAAESDDLTNTCFTSDAATALELGTSPYTGNFLPLQQMGLMNNGQSANGTWRLYVLDNLPFVNSGEVLSWSLTFSNDPAQYVHLMSSDLPIVKIDTYGQMIQDADKIPAAMGIIYNGPGVRNETTDPFNDFDGTIGIELRGHSSLTFPKKNYGIEVRDELDEDLEVPLLGMPVESDWILYGSWSDKSLMNNVLTFELGRQMGHYAPRTRYVELVINNTYLGTYVLMEKIKRDGDRVDIAKLPADEIAGDSLTGGYILKIDRPEIGTYSWTSQYPPYNAPGEESIEFLLDYPDDPMPEQAAYIQAFVDSFETALAGPYFADPLLGYANYIDASTFVDFMIMTELSRNVDGYRLSAYLYKDKNSNDRHLKMGPLWDFDLGWDNANYCNGDAVEGWMYLFNYANCPEAYELVPFWWERLMQDPAYVNALKCRWEELRSDVLNTDSLLMWCDATATLLDETQQRNFTAWPILGAYIWPNPQPIPADHAGEVAELKTWIQERAQWIDDNLPGLCTIGVSEGASSTAQVSAFPNPFDDRITIDLPPGMHEGTDVVVSDVYGRTLLQRSFTPDEVQGSRVQLTTPTCWAEGTYFISIRSNDRVLSLPLTKVGR